MIKRLVIVVFLGATSALADGVYLRHSRNRMIYGPVLPGTRLELAGGRDSFMPELYDCVVPSAAEIQVVSNLQAIVIPLIRLTNAPITEVIEEINRQTHQAGVTSLVVRVDQEGYRWGNDVPSLRSSNSDSLANVPSVSLVWRYVSVFTILEGISRMTDLPVNIVDGKVVFSQKTKEQLFNKPVKATR